MFVSPIYVGCTPGQTKKRKSVCLLWLTSREGPAVCHVSGSSSAALQGYEAHVLEGGRATLLERRIPFIHSEVGPVMLGGAGSNATAFLEAFVQARPRTTKRIIYVMLHGQVPLTSFKS